MNDTGCLLYTYMTPIKAFSEVHVWETRSVARDTRCPLRNIADTRHVIWRTRHDARQKDEWHHCTDIGVNTYIYIHICIYVQRETEIERGRGKVRKREANKTETTRERERVREKERQRDTGTERHRKRERELNTMTGQGWRTCTSGQDSAKASQTQLFPASSCIFGYKVSTSHLQSAGKCMVFVRTVGLWKLWQHIWFCWSFT